MPSKQKYKRVSVAAWGSHEPLEVEFQMHDYKPTCAQARKSSCMKIDKAHTRRQRQKREHQPRPRSVPRPRVRRSQFVESEGHKHDSAADEKPVQPCFHQRKAVAIRLHFQRLRKGAKRADREVIRIRRRQCEEPKPHEEPKPGFKHFKTRLYKANPNLIVRLFHAAKQLLNLCDRILHLAMRGVDLELNDKAQYLFGRYAKRSATLSVLFHRLVRKATLTSIKTVRREQRRASKGGRRGQLLNPRRLELAPMFVDNLNKFYAAQNTKNDMLREQIYAGPDVANAGQVARDLVEPRLRRYAEAFAQELHLEVPDQADVAAWKEFVNLILEVLNGKVRNDESVQEQDQAPPQNQDDGQQAQHAENQNRKEDTKGPSTSKQVQSDVNQQAQEHQAGGQQAENVKNDNEGHADKSAIAEPIQQQANQAPPENQADVQQAEHADNDDQEEDTEGPSTSEQVQYNVDQQAQEHQAGGQQAEDVKNGNVGHTEEPATLEQIQPKLNESPQQAHVDGQQAGHSNDESGEDAEERPVAEPNIPLVNQAAQPAQVDDQQAEHVSNGNEGNDEEPIQESIQSQGDQTPQQRREGQTTGPVNKDVDQGGQAHDEQRETNESPAPETEHANGTDADAERPDQANSPSQIA